MSSISSGPQRAHRLGACADAPRFSGRKADVGADPEAWLRNLLGLPESPPDTFRPWAQDDPDNKGLWQRVSLHRDLAWKLGKAVNPRIRDMADANDHLYPGAVAHDCEPSVPAFLNSPSAEAAETLGLPENTPKDVIEAAKSTVAQFFHY